MTFKLAWLWVRSHKSMTLLIAAGLAVVTLFGLWRYERGKHFDASLRAENNLAQADTSKRIVDARVQKVLGDSTAAWQRRSLQIEQRADSLDEILKLERKSRTDIGVTIDRGTGRASGAVTIAPAVAGSAAPSSDIRQAHFDVKAGVFDVAADVQLPAPPARGTMEATVTAPKIPLGIRQYCGSATDGIRRADVVVTGPAWATIGIERVETSPEMCNANRQLQSSGLRLPWWVNLLTFAGGVVAGSKL